VKKSINEWIKLIQKRDGSLISQFKSIYGQDRTLINERLDRFLQVAKEFKKIYGENKEVSFVRAPGRLNTLGKHIDHRGGFVNSIAISKEVILCYTNRDDDLIQVHNMGVSYDQRRFNITEELPLNKLDTVKSWLAWTQEKTDIRKQNNVNHDWVNKLKAVPIYLQVIYPDRTLSGFDSVLDSNIPAQTGLSSSSSIVVAIMEVMIDINNISITDEQFVNYCGIAEWFVGTRGGSGDHAAIKFSRLGMITHMKTIPQLMIGSYLPFPGGYKMIIFNSGITADKSGQAQQKFNEKISTYEIGEIYVKEYMKKHYESIFHKIVTGRNFLKAGEKKFYLADVVEHLNQHQIYELLQSLPERIARQKLLTQFPEYENLLKEQFDTHLEPESGYHVRSVVTYGITESERSKMVENVLGKSKIELFGQLMNISHDGDRVSFQSPEMENRKRSLDMKEELYLLPGEYNCSIPEIDKMVDLCLEAGAEGAQISGAGLGGSIMALVEKENFNRVIEIMRDKYYQPHQIKEDFFVASAIQGASQL